MSSSQGPVRILSFDGGGVRGLSSLLILRALMDRLGVKKGVVQTDDIRPSECFDLVIGTGTGGLSAILVGRIGMTAHEAIKAYMTVAKAAFEPTTIGNPTRALQHTVEDIVMEFLGDRSAKLEVPSNNSFTCHTAVLAARSTYANAPPHIFRSYTNGGPPSPEAISQVIRAIISDSSSTFRPVKLGNPPINYVDAGISGYNNPVEIALTQAAQIWPDREKIIVSLGTGQRGIVTVDKGRSQVAEAYRSIIQSCEEVHERILRSQLPHYFRFNVDRGLASDVQEWKDESIAAMTDGHMSGGEVERCLDRCAHELSGETLMRTKHGPTQEDLSTINWLSSLNFKQLQNDIFERRQEGTGKWFLESDIFKDWLDGQFRVLWCPGMPGSGKTVLTSTVVNHLEAALGDRKVAITYIYCNYKDQAEQTATKLIASLLKQIVQASNIISNDIKALHDTNIKDQTHPTLQKLTTTLKSEILNFSKVYIIIDALDECHESTQSALLWELQSLAITTNLLITSRSWPPSVGSFQGTKCLEIYADDHDVCCYVAERIAYTLKPHLISLQERIIEKVVGNVKGMFLLAQLHMNLLERTQNTAQLRHALDNLPGGVDDTYDEAMKRIEQQTEEDRNLAKEMLSWITYAYRPLSTTELQHALAVKSGTTDIDPENITDEKTLISVCAGLVVVDKENNVIHLVHYTTQQYFEHKGYIHFPNAQAKITAKCLTYLSFYRFAAGYYNTTAELKSLLKDNPLLDYAAQHWGSHARFCQSEEHCKKMAKNFLDTSPNLPLVRQVMLVEPGFYWYSRWSIRNFTGIHMAAFFGLQIIMECQLRDAPVADPKERGAQTFRSKIAKWIRRFVHPRAQHNAMANSKDGDGRTPLSWAAERGYEAAVRLLVSRNDVVADSKDENDRTPLSWAAARGQEAVVRLLILRNDVVADLKDKSGRTPLSRAAERGHEAVMRLLVSRNDVEADSKDNFGQTPLSLAAQGGHEEVVRLLVSRNDVVVDSKDKNGWSPLSLAAARGHEAIVRLLVSQNDVAADSKDENGRTPLSLAAEWGHEAVVLLLLSRNDVVADSKDKLGRTPLSMAAEGRHEAVMRLLLSRNDVEADSKDKFGKTSLSRAAERGNQEVVQLLVSRNDVVADAKDKKGRSPLSLAAARGHEAVARLLVSRNDVVAESKDENGRTPLSLAAEWGHEAVVRFLVSRNDVEADSKDNFGQTPLSLAAEEGCEEVVRLLLSRNDVEADSKDQFNRTPLSWAAARGHEAVVQLLVSQNGVTADSKDENGWSPLSLAAARGREAVVRLLVSRNDVVADSRDENGQTPLSLAAEGGHEAVMQLLVSRNDVVVDSKDKFCRTPLLMAAAGGQEAAVRLLVSRNDVVVDSKDKLGRTPLSLAARYGHKAIEQTLIAAGATNTALGVAAASCI